ncbi:hypothetical protein ACO0RG_001114 [Hanseniaspora osmophila]|uniref:Splicing factor 3B subunit 5 n=1 Tax=Hanseniaspora osmophila TaxID=56408 RepID=A0A1E5RNZ2_9ASCO|nr:hypothetical protein AWRI3579_g750 [Hanseniaspora osmophila]
MTDRARYGEALSTMKDKYVALGDDNTTSEEWLSNVHRDTYNLMMHSSALLEYTSVASGSQSKFETRLKLLEKMKAPQFNNPDKRKFEEYTDVSKK